MARAAIDIGTNSVRLLIVDDDGAELARLSRVTALGRDLSSTGTLSPVGVERTLDVLAGYRSEIESRRAEVRAVATSASRDASDTEAFLDRAEEALGWRPEVIDGEAEARLSYLGATVRHSGEEIVVDVGGGSTEFVRWVDTLEAVSVDMGSLRLNGMHLPDRPASFEQVEAAGQAVEEAFSAIEPSDGRPVLGVGGTWTTLADIVAGQAGAAAEDPHLDRTTLDRWVARLSSLTLEETEDLPGIDPARAPVILAGAIVARGAMRVLRADVVGVEVHDILDGVVADMA